MQVSPQYRQPVSVQLSSVVPMLTTLSGTFEVPPWSWWWWNIKLILVQVTFTRDFFNFFQNILNYHPTIFAKFQKHMRANLQKQKQSL